MNCLIVDDEAMSRKTVEHFCENTDFIKNYFSVADASSAIEKLKNEDVDLIFLDIEMPEMTGIEFLESLDITPEVIIITSKEDYAARAFEFDVRDYLVKPIDYERFVKAAEKSKRAIEQNTKADQEALTDVFVKSDSKIVRVNLKELQFIEALADYVVLNVPGKKHIVHSTMKGILNKLPSELFVRAHRSYIVNVKKVEVIEDMTISIGEKHIPIGASYKEEFFKHINLL